MKYLIDGLDYQQFPIPKYDKSEIIGNILAAGLFVIQWLYFLVKYYNLPENIPVQFNLEGQPEQYGNKTTLFVFPGVMTLIVVILTILERFPDRFKYSLRLDENNAPTVYKYARKFIIYMKIVTCALFLFLISQMISVVNLKSKPKEMYFCFLFVPVYLFGVFVYFRYMKIIQNKQKKVTI
ncbi:hypothetical protein ABPG74_011210 [Tetrahymena malaccensis]